jgi:putative DNA primase/helicase
VVDEPALLQVTGTDWRGPHARRIARWLGLVTAPGQVVELRALNVAMPGGARLTWSGFFADDLDTLADRALDLTAEADGVYVTLNPLDPSLLARRYHRVEPARDTAADADVLRRRWLLVDADPVRKAGISATDAEKRAAWATAGAAFAWLAGRGWPDPVVADSGNGYHLLYPLDLPRDDGGLVKRVLEALAARLDGPAVRIDTKVANPGRIVKLYGTLARKGDPVRERPHRWTGVLAAPQAIGVVTREQLEAVAGQPVRSRGIDLPPAATPLASGALADRLGRARQYLAKVPPAVAGEGGHNQTFKAACILLRFGLAEEEAMTVFREWNATCQPPWEEKDLRKKLRDAAARVRTDGSRAAGGGPQDAGGAGPGGDGADAAGPAGDLPLEAPDDPHRLAKLFLDGGRAADGAASVRYWNGDWYQWDGRVYAATPEDAIRAGLTRATKGEFDRLSLARGVPDAGAPLALPGRRPARKVTLALVTNALQALRSVTFVAPAVAPPAWLDGAGPAPAGEVVVAANGVFHLPGLLAGGPARWPLTPRLFTTAALDYPIDPAAPAPAAWLAFLADLWPGDAESVGLLQEWFGYCLTPDTGQQKMLLIVGPKRAGKGTLGRVLTALVGPANAAGPTLNSLATQFGLAPLLHKTVAVVADARFSGRAADQAAVVERLLSVSGEDPLTIDRKNRAHVTARLPTRFTILTNELPRLADASAALASRLLVLQLSRSWYGAEDPGLEGRLLPERPGIFRWALEGLRRLRARGRFVQPASGAETAARVVELSSPVTAFVQEQCVVNPRQAVAKRTLFEAWRRWCQDSGNEPGSIGTFGRNLLAAFPDVRSSRPRDGEARVLTYLGIGLRVL